MLGEVKVPVLWGQELGPVAREENLGMWRYPGKNRIWRWSQERTGNLCGCTFSSLEPIQVWLLRAGTVQLSPPGSSTCSSLGSGATLAGARHVLALVQPVLSRDLVKGVVGRGQVWSGGSREALGCADLS